MLAFILLSSCVICFFAYRFYGKFLTDRCKLDDGQTTPAFEKEDGVDYSPTRASVLFGHHFSSITGAGPIVGPILAAMYFGWGPTWVWILVGAILVGGVHDFEVPSCQYVMEAVPLPIPCVDCGGGSREIIYGLVVLALVYVIIVFLDLTANTFAKQPAVATASGLVYWSGCDFWVSDEEWQVFPWTACLDLFPADFCRAGGGALFPHGGVG